MFDASENPLADPMRMAIILDDNGASSERLRRTLGALGYQAQVVTDASVALRALRASAAPLAVFFNVEAYGETLDGESYVSMIGALLNDPELARRHLYAVISSTADDVEVTLGKTLARLETPILGKPCDPATLAAHLARTRAERAPTDTEPRLIVGV